MAGETLVISASHYRMFIETSYRKLYRKLAKFPPKSGVSPRTSCSWFLRNVVSDHFGG